MIFSLKQGLAVSLKKDKGCLADEARLSRSPLSPLGWDITWGGAGGYRLNKKSPARPAAAPLGRGPPKNQASGVRRKCPRRDGPRLGHSCPIWGGLDDLQIYSTWAGWGGIKFKRKHLKLKRKHLKLKRKHLKLKRKHLQAQQE